MFSDAKVEPERASRNGLLAAGGVIGAIAASSCCVLPLVLFSLGVSGAWMANLTALARYQWLFVGATFACLGAGFYLVFRKPKLACADGQRCTRPQSGRLTKLTLWIATALVLSAIAFPYIAPFLLDT